MTMDEKTRAFTLIELLVVVSILALLISSLLPSLTKAKKQARQVACASNVRQLGQAMEMYVNLYGCYVPVATERGEYGRWLRLIGDVHSAKNEAKQSVLTQLGTCPEVPEWAKVLKITNHRMDRDIAYGYNYIYLGDSRGLWKPGKGRFPVRPSEIRSPSRTVSIADSDGTGGWCPQPHPYTPDGSDPNALGHHGFMIDPPELPPDAENGPADDPAQCTLSTKPGFARVSNRHFGGASVLYVDGHVHWVKRDLLEIDNLPWNGRDREP
jgi:prepilin-type N-terminal cleavage/methylation domain-containing protein/prepilin-type processing-associated H-X9-DG protein